MEEPSLVGFILKLNLVDVLLANVPWNLLKPCPFYWRGYWGVKSTSNVCNQETKASIYANFNKFLWDLYLAML
jgi:hypothetical protein